MARIKTLKENELIGGTDNTSVYPVTTTQAIYSQSADGTIPGGIKHQLLEDRLSDDEEDLRELKNNAERLIVSLEADKGYQVVEITGESNHVTLTGAVGLETFAGSVTSIPISELEVSKLTISSGEATIEEINDWEGNTTYTLMNTTGVYSFRFDCTYNGVTGFKSSLVGVSLRKYFGFAEEIPTDITALDLSHFSNDVACNITIPAKGTGFKRIYFAVPNGMTIERITQPDAMDAPLYFTLVGTVTRTINNVEYGYKLYQSDALIDASVNKHLIIW